jgi:hypothetical protein
LQLPLYHNPSVARGDFNKISILIKTVSTGEVKETIEVNIDSSIQFNDLITINTFEQAYAIGQYYKLQMAYIAQDDTVGYYSQVGVFKCTAKPTVTIPALTANQLNNSTYTFTGRYESEQDRSEKVYSYSFIIKDSNGIYDTSGVLLHNANNDTNDTSTVDTWTPNKMLKDHTRYGVIYTVTTINGVEISSPEYIVTIGQDGYINDENGFLIAVLDQDNGCVDLYFKKSNGDTAFM